MSSSMVVYIIVIILMLLSILMLALAATGYWAVGTNNTTSLTTSTINGLGSACMILMILVLFCSFLIGFETYDSSARDKRNVEMEQELAQKKIEAEYKLANPIAINLTPELKKLPEVSKLQKGKRINFIDVTVPLAPPKTETVKAAPMSGDSFSLTSGGAVSAPTAKAVYSGDSFSLTSLSPMTQSVQKKHKKKEKKEETPVDTKKKEKKVEIADEDSKKVPIEEKKESEEEPVKQKKQKKQAPNLIDNLDKSIDLYIKGVDAADKTIKTYNQLANTRNIPVPAPTQV